MTSTLRRSLALQTLLLALFMDLLDNGIVNVAIPTIVTRLGASASEIQWIVSAYTLAFSLFLLLTARLGDLWGRKKMFLAGVFGFTLFSALCGLAPTAGLLIAARSFQGLAAAFMVPQVLASIQVMFAPAERGGAIGAFSMLAGLANTVSPLLGAWLTVSNVFGLGWKSIFWVNVPVGIIAFVAALIFLPESDSRSAVKKQGLDFVGTLLSIVATLLLVYPLIVGRSEGWPLWTAVSFAGSLVFWILFAVVEHGKETRGKAPLVQVSLFRVRSFLSGLTLSLVYMMGIIGFFFSMVIYLQLGLGFSLIHSALTMLPWSLAVPLGAGIAAGALIPRFGRIIVQIGLVLTVAGLAWLSVLVPSVTLAAQTLPLLPGIAIGGLGMGFAVAGFASFTVNEVPEDQAGRASGVYNMVMQLAAALGVAILGTIFFSNAGSLDAVSILGAFRVSLYVVLGLIAMGILASFGLPGKLAHSEH